MPNGELDISSCVVAVTSSNQALQRFGTAFVIFRTQKTTYLLTCNHVVKDVGSEGLLVGYQPAIVVACDEHFDLALLSCEGNIEAPTLPLRQLTDFPSSIRCAGYSSIGKHQLTIKHYNFTLEEKIELESRQRQCRSHGWRLRVNGELSTGSSGAPAIDPQGFVIGIVSHKLNSEQGFAISIDALPRIWSDAPVGLIQSVQQISNNYRTYSQRDTEFLMNCEKELEIFTRIASGAKNDIRLINIYGESGMGKSRLLREFQLIAEEYTLDYLHFPLGVTSIVEERLDEVISHYNASSFPSYDEIRSNRPESPTRDKEQNWLNNLTRAFIRDLSTNLNSTFGIQRLVLFFDQYEKSNEIFRWWMEHSFFVHLPARPLTIVIAGHHPIGRKPAWQGLHLVHLNGVSEEWYQKYAKYCGIEIEADRIKFAYELLNGKPKEWVEFIGSQPTAEQVTGVS